MERSTMGDGRANDERAPPRYLRSRRPIPKFAQPLRLSQNAAHWPMILDSRDPYIKPLELDTKASMIDA